ncbi:MAG: hypothetical protein R6U04_03195 [Bacteroidales bacterium]
MKHIIFIIALSFGMALQGVSQELTIVSEPGFAVYVDGDFKGLTPNVRKGLVLEGLPLGTCRVVVKLDELFSREFTVDIREGSNEISVNAFGEGIFPRSNGYYIGAYDTVSVGLFGREVTRNVVLYTGIDNPSTRDRVEFSWTLLELPVGRKKSDKLIEVYRKWLALYRALDRSKAHRNGIYGGELRFDDTIASFKLDYAVRDGRDQFTGQPVFDYREIHWFARLSEEGKHFVMTLLEPPSGPALDYYGSKGMEEKKVDFSFVPLTPWEEE